MYLSIFPVSYSYLHQQNLYIGKSIGLQLVPLLLSVLQLVFATDTPMYFYSIQAIYRKVATLQGYYLIDYPYLLSNLYKLFYTRETAILLSMSSDKGFSPYTPSNNR